MQNQKTRSIKLTAFYKNANVGSVMVPEGTEFINMSTGCQIPVTRAADSSHEYVVYLEPHHNKRNPSLW